jgi:hypothetical protein
MKDTNSFVEDLSYNNRPSENTNDEKNLIAQLKPVSV